MNQEEFRSMGRWVYVGGTFDLFHAGHVNFLKSVRAASGGKRIVVALNTDHFAEKYKRKPIMTLTERWPLLETNRLVDKVVVNWGDEDSWMTILALIEEGLDIAYIAHGDDWVGPTLMRQMNLTHGGMAARRIELLHVPYTEGISSTEIEHRVNMRMTGQPQTKIAVCCGDPGDCGC